MSRKRIAHGILHNYCIHQPVRSVTGLAGASPAPARPASDAFVRQARRPILGSTMRVISLICLVLGPLLGWSCAGSPPRLEQFAIYRLADSTLSVADAAKWDLGDLTLEADPFMATTDIIAYSWSDHVFDVTPAMLARLEDIGARPYMSRGMPFVVMVGEERRYLGAFWYGYSSLAPTVPHITVAPLFRPLRLRQSWPIVDDAVDLRQDERVHGALKRAGLLKD